MFPLKLDLKLFIVLFLSFVLATIVGTVSHEYGHWAVAKYFGYETSVSYGYMVWDDKEKSSFIESTYLKYCEEIEAGFDFPKKEKFESILEEYSEDGFWITLGGPLQTMLVGTMGLFFLILNGRKPPRTIKLSAGQWFPVFLSLFWLRQLANLSAGFLGYILNGTFSLAGDEIGLALHLGWPFWSISLATAIIGLAVLVFVFFKIIPVQKRITFLLAGLFGGIFGYFFWLHWVGPILMP